MVRFSAIHHLRQGATKTTNSERHEGVGGERITPQASGTVGGDRITPRPVSDSRSIGLESRGLTHAIRSQNSGEIHQRDNPEAVASTSGAAESRDQVSNSDANSSNTPHGAIDETLRGPVACHRTTVNLKWSEKDKQTLLALFMKYLEGKNFLQKVYDDWEALRANRELDNNIHRSKIALNKIRIKYLTQNVNPHNDPNITPQNPTQRDCSLIPPLEVENMDNLDMEIEEVQVTEDANSAAEVTAIVLPEITQKFFDLFWDKVKCEFTKACKYKGFCRPALKKPSNQIPPELRLVGDLLIQNLVPMTNTLEKLDSAVYAIGKVILDFMAEKHKSAYQETEKAQKTRNYNSKRLEKFLAWTQDEISRREAHKQPNESQWARLRKLRKEFEGLKSLSNFRILKEKLLCKLRIVKKKIAVCEEERARRRIRKLPLRKALQTTEKASDLGLSVSKVRNFWAEIIGMKRTFTNCEELTEWRDSLNADSQILNLEKTANEWKTVCKKAKPWKASGPDGIPTGIWKAFPSATNKLLKHIMVMIENKKQIPAWFGMGRAVLLYKKGERTDPNNYRTIVCLNTGYKLATALVTHWLQDQLKVSNALPEEQLAGRKEKWACMEAHTLDSTITSDAVNSTKRKQPNSETLSMAWIDFSKAFDSVPHSLIRWVLRSIGLDKRVRRFIRDLMKTWTIQYEQYKGTKCLKSNPLRVKNGVLQGDTLSPLLYCICIAPFSHWLNKHIPKYISAFNSRKHGKEPLTLNHLFYMDDLKLYTPKSSDLGKAVEGIIRLGRNMALRVNADKCGRTSVGAILQDGMEHSVALEDFPLIEKAEAYKYLGIEQNIRTKHELLWERIESTVLKRTKAIFSSKLSIRQMVNGYNVTVPAIVRFATTCAIFGKGSFLQQCSLMNNIDKKVRGILTECGVRFPFSSTYRLYALAENGGLGLKSIKDAYEESIIYAFCYLSCTKALQIPREYMLGSSTQRNTITDFTKIMERYEISTHGPMAMIEAIPLQQGLEIRGVHFLTAKLAARKIIGLVNMARNSATQRNLGREGSPLRAICGFQMAAMITDYSRWGLDKANSWIWLKRGKIGPKVVRNILAAQDNQLLAGYHRGVRRVCRTLCKKQNTPTENVAHIISGCEHWSSSLYTERHNMVANIIYLDICKKYGLTCGKYQTRVSEVLENDKAKLYWNVSVQASVAIKHNQPDIICFEKDTEKPNRFKKIWIIEIAVAWYQKLAKKEREKYHRYAINSQTDSQHPDVNLQCELGKMYNCKVETVPIVIGVFGDVSTDLATNLLQLELKSDRKILIEKLQRSAVLGSHWVIKAHMSLTTQ